MTAYLLSYCFAFWFLFSTTDTQKISGVNGRSCKFVIGKLHHLPFTPEIVEGKKWHLMSRQENV